MKKILFLFLALSAAQIGHAQNAADTGGITAPALVAPGTTFTATITMTNTGGNAWTTAGLYALGSDSPRNNETFLAGARVALPADPINPGEVAVFTATFTAPTVPGIYHFTWRMVQDTVEWFGQIASRTIRVGSGHFTPGDVVVMQIVPTGSDFISGNGTAMVLKNISLSSLNTTFQVALPINGTNAFITGGNPFTGMVDLSTDKNYLVIGGYSANLPFTASVEAAGSPVPRAIGTVNFGGQYRLGATVTPPTGFTGGTFRGAVADGRGNFWGGAQNSGIYYFGTNASPVQISTLGTGAGTGAIRNLMMVNGRPYFSTSQFPAPGNFGLGAFPSVSPVTPEEPTLVLDSGNAVTGASGTASPKGFYVNTNLTIAYVVDLRASPNGGIYRFNGTGTGLAGSWTYAYTITNNLFDTGGFFQDVIADFSGANPKIYATAGAVVSGNTAGTNLVSAIDMGAATTTFTLLATAPLNQTYRGLAFAPNPVSLSIVKSGTNVIIRWPGDGALQSAGVVTGPYVPVTGSPTSPYTNAASAAAQFYGVGFP